MQDKNFKIYECIHFIFSNLDLVNNLCIDFPYKCAVVLIC